MKENAELLVLHELALMLKSESRKGEETYKLSSYFSSVFKYFIYQTTLLCLVMFLCTYETIADAGTSMILFSSEKLQFQCKDTRTFWSRNFLA